MITFWQKPKKRKKHDHRTMPCLKADSSINSNGRRVWHRNWKEHDWCMIQVFGTEILLTFYKINTSLQNCHFFQHRSSHFYLQTMTWSYVRQEAGNDSHAIFPRHQTTDAGEGKGHISATNLFKDLHNTHSVQGTWVQGGIHWTM